MSNRTLKLVSNFAGLAMLVLGAIAAFDWLNTIKPVGGIKLPQIFAGLATIAGVISRWAAGQLPCPPEKPSSPKSPPLAPTMLVVGLLALVSAAVMPACGNLTAGYRAAAVTVKVGNETGSTMASVCKAKRLACVKAHPAASVELEECLRPCRKALTAWVKVVRPSINTATEATFAALETARQARKSDGSWVAKLRPGVCALVRVLGEWRGLLGEKAAEWLGLLRSVEGFVCSR